MSDSCGLDIGILIDRSGSIADAGKATEMRESAKALVDALAGTPSAVGVWSFGDDSSATGTSSYPAQQLTEVGGASGPAGVASLKATIDSIPIVSRVATNWEAGFAAVHTASTMPGSRAPEVLFVLTDGKPTVHIGDASSGGTTNNDDVDGGIRTANLVKSLGTRIFAVGIGAGIDATTLALIANNLAFDGSNVTTAGYALTNFDDLQATLRRIATALCGGSVTVQKLADPGNGVFSPASGWEFTLDPSNSQIPDQTTTTDDNGQANFNLTSASTEQVTLTENPGSKAGYQLLAEQVVCTNSNGRAPKLTAVTNGVRFDLGPTDIVSCTFKNRKQVVDLGIVKTDGGVSTVPGGTVTYTLSYGNKGNTAAPGTVITETVPVNTTVDLGTGPIDGKNDGWVCNGLESGSFPAGTTCTRAVGTVAAGASGLTVTFTVRINNPVPFDTTQITNTAVIGYDSSAGPDSDLSDNTATDTTPVSVRPRLTVVKTSVLQGQACPGVDGTTLTILAGQSVTYCYRVSNLGNVALVDVTLVDDNGTPGDPGDDFTVTLTGLTDQDGDTQVDDLATGASATGASSPLSFEPGTIVNVAVASGSSGTGEQLSDTDAAVVQVNDVAPTVQVTKSANRSSVDEPGAPVIFTVSIRNTSAESVTVTSITDSVEGGTPFSVTSAAAPVTATTCATGVSISPGTTYICTFALPVSGDAGDVVTDTVVGSVVDDDGTSVSDRDDASVAITDVPPTIEVTKDDGEASVVAPGGAVTYTVSIANTSPEAVTVTSITDSVDGGPAFSVAAPAVDPVLTTTCETGTRIEPGGLYTCEFTVRVSGSGGQTVTDTVVATVVDDDNTTVTDGDDEQTPVTPSADLAIVKETPSAAFTVGQQATYTLRVTNNGPSTATNLVVTDTLPAGLSLVSIDAPAGWVCSGTAVVTCTGASLAVGGTVEIRLVTLVGAAAQPSVTNAAQVSGAEPDSDLSNNRDETTTPVVAVAGVTQVRPPTQQGPLPRTGFDLARWTALGVLLSGVGIALVAVGRRRRA
ncbi:MAG: VWA domain-containing protein [Acidimicrobiales bacterium]